jgi:hypothetical protein
MEIHLNNGAIILQNVIDNFLFLKYYPGPVLYFNAFHHYPFI